MSYGHLGIVRNCELYEGNWDLVGDEDDGIEASIADRRGVTGIQPQLLTLGWQLLLGNSC